MSSRDDESLVTEACKVTSVLRDTVLIFVNLDRHIVKHNFSFLISRFKKCSQYVYRNNKTYLIGYL